MERGGSIFSNCLPTEKMQKALIRFFERIVFMQFLSQSHLGYNPINDSVTPQLNSELRLL